MPNTAACRCSVSMGWRLSRMAALMQKPLKMPCGWHERRHRPVSRQLSPRDWRSWEREQQKDKLPRCSKEYAPGNSRTAGHILGILLSFFLAFSDAAHFADATVEIGGLSSFGRVATFLAHLRE